MKKLFKIFFKKKKTSPNPKEMIFKAREFLNIINSECKTLEDLLQIHKNIWNSGFQNENLGPCSYGFFRTDNICTMNIREVYLGNKYGLVTKPIPYWNNHSEDCFGVNGFGIDPKTKIYTIIYNQYKNLLISNLESFIHFYKQKL